MKLNLKFYKEDLLYDKFITTDIEEKIIENYIKKLSPNEYSKVFKEDKSVETVYALSDNTKNILEWYPFKHDCDILEIGARLGEITGTLCDNARKVVSVEFSKKRGEAISIRHKERENLEVIVRKSAKYKSRRKI